MPCYNYYQHGFGKNSIVCRPRTLGTDEYCEGCEMAETAFAAGNKKEGLANLPKQGYWFCFIPLMKGYEAVPHILGVPYRSAQVIFGRLANEGGWKAMDVDLNDAACLSALSKGINKCYGNSGYDLIWSYDKNSQDRSKVWSAQRFSDGKGKKLKEDFETPNFEDKFRIIKKLGGDDGPSSSEPSAPPPVFADMSVKLLKEYAKANDIITTGCKKKVDFVEACTNG
jgi:hypothetical protein